MKVKNRIDIPKHDKCTGCSECCGPVPINQKECDEITRFVKDKHPPYNKNAGIMDCKFRVDKNCTIVNDGAGCSIYPVRPIICRLMGVTKGMMCNNGNSASIDGTEFIDRNIKIVGLLNNKIKTNY